MGRKGFGKRGLRLVSRLEVPSVVVGFLSHGNWNRKGMAATVAAGGRAGEWRARAARARHGEEEDERKSFLGVHGHGLPPSEYVGPIFLFQQKKS